MDRTAETRKVVPFGTVHSLKREQKTETKVPVFQPFEVWKIQQEAMKNASRNLPLRR